MTGPVNVKKISTLNVKSGRSGKWGKKSTLNLKSGRSGKCEKSLVGCMTSQMVCLDNLVGLVSFFVIFGFRGVNISKVKNPGSVMIFRESVKLKKKTCEWIREIVGGFRG